MSNTLRVDDMSCDGCEDIVENALEEISGVESAAADNEAGTVVVDGSADLEDLMDAVDYAGYTAEVAEQTEDSANSNDEETAGDE